MARVSFSEAKDETTNGFFKLEDGEVARVQFLISNPDDIPTFYVHHVDVDGFEYGKDVQCNRTDYEDSECELCKAGILRKTASVLIMYDLNDNTIKLWQRSKKWISEKITPFLNRYKDLKNLVVEIERHGKKLDTSYTLFPLPDEEPEDVSELEIPTDFDFMLWKKSNDEMLTWLNTGDFPKAEDSEQEQPTRRRVSEQPTRRGSATPRSRRG